MAKHILNTDFEKNKYEVWFSMLKDIPLKIRMNLIEDLHCAKNVFEADEISLLETKGMDLNYLTYLMKEKNNSPDSIYEAILNQDIDLVSIENENYPLLLRDIPDRPYSLFYKGKFPQPTIPSIGIVGARMCTNYGARMAYDIAHTLAGSSYNIVSGMALGIDRHAHAGALDANGMTTAVLGCGVDICYPGNNKDLYNRIIENGCVLSEYTPGTQAVSQFFPRRNRIICGMTSALVVTEARIKSGSLITANLSTSYNRDVYALPGRVSDPLSRGTNNLIQEGAIVLESISFLSKDLEEKHGTTVLEPSILTDISLTENEQIVLSEIDYYALHIDSILEKASPLSEESIYQCINTLKEKGKIKEIFPDYFVKN